MKVDLKNISKRVSVHVLFWLISLFFFWWLFSRNTQDRVNTAVFMAILSPVAIGLTYYFNYYLIPRFLMSGNYFKFGWYGVAASIVGLWLSLMGGVFVWIWLADYNLGEVSYATIDVTMLVAALFFVVAMGVSIKLFRINLQTLYNKEKAEREHLMVDNQLKMSELRMLKEQLNPHFLFNTLNNIYGLTLEKSEKAPELVMQLSNILDYMLYRTNDEKVKLADELEMIKNYIAIEEQRFEGRYPVRFSIDGDIGDIHVAPLVFLPIIENCFKHGVRKSILGSPISILFLVDDDKVILSTKNEIIKEEKQSGGIGLLNLRKRLDMLYSNRYSLIINDNDSMFECKLEIHL